MRTDRALRSRGLLAALVGLCLVEILSWGVLYYTLPVASTRIEAATGWRSGTVSVVYTSSLVAAAIIGVRAGRLLDEWGPRRVMVAGALLGAVAMAASAATTSVWAFAAAWLVVGAAQTCTLYPPAFAAALQWFGRSSSWPVTIITLAGGLASTVFAPVIAWLIDAYGWQTAIVTLAVGYGVVCTLAAGTLLRPAWQRPEAHEVRRTREQITTTHSGAFLRLQVAFAITGAGLYGVTLSLVPLLQELDYSYRTAAILFGLVGAGQVLGRLAFVPLANRGTPRAKTLVQVLLSGVMLLVLGVVVGPTALLIACVVTAGAVRGAHTLSVATAVSERWGSTGYATIFGRFNLPIALAIALGPALTHLVADWLGSYQGAALLFAGASLVSLVLARRT